jgi:hypothetical protein
VTGVAEEALLSVPVPGVEGADFFWPSAGAVRATWLSRTLANGALGVAVGS